MLSMPEAHLQKFKFGEFVLDLGRGTLQRSGEYIGLRPQAFEVLACLATRNGKLVSRDELLNAVWDNVIVTDDSLTQCIVEIRKAIDDEAHTIIRTVPRRGFIFNPPETIATDAASNSDPSAGSRADRWQMLRIGGATAVIAVIAMLSIGNMEPGLLVGTTGAGVSPNSIAVLPFADMSEAGNQQYFGDGIAEEILIQMAAYPDLVVTARTSSFRFRDRQADAIDIGRSLNAAYVIEGSIRRSGSRLRITAQLIETQGGTHEWSRSFDKELMAANSLDIQAEVAADIAESIGTGAFRFHRRHTGRSTAIADAHDLHRQQIVTAEREDVDMDAQRVAIDR